MSHVHTDRMTAQMASFVPDDSDPVPLALLSPTPLASDASRSRVVAPDGQRRAALAQQRGVERQKIGLAAQRKALLQAKTTPEDSVRVVPSAPTPTPQSRPLTAAQQRARKRRIAEGELAEYEVYVPPAALKLDIEKGTDLLRYWDVRCAVPLCV
jgi:hypothetical protein